MIDSSASSSAWVGRINGSKGWWNYRLFTRQVPTGEGDTEPEFFVGEAYYDGTGQVTGWTGPVEALGESRDEVRNELNRMLEALDKPMLNYDASPTPANGNSAPSAKIEEANDRGN